MSHANQDDLARELARTLAASLERALAPEATPRSAEAARDAAQVLGLKGLDRLLDALLVQAARPWDLDLIPIVDRMRHLITESSGRTLEYFQGAEAETADLALRVESIEAGADVAAGRPGPKTIRLSQVLEDVPLADETTRERARRVRVTAPVAAALRAAIDWLSHDNGPPAPLRFTSEESVLEVVCDKANLLGLKPAEKVLGAVGGVLLPGTSSGLSPVPPGAWVIRVPTHAGMNSYLMLHQGDLAIALPWHSVIRLYMGRGIDLRGGFGERGLRVLEPLAPLEGQRAEYPVVLIGHGLKRAYLVADRLVWRLSAEPFESGVPGPIPGLARSVQTEDGEQFWVGDPSVLLERIEQPSLPLTPRPAAAPAAAERPARASDDVAPPSRPPENAEPPALAPEDVEPLPLPAAAMPAPPATPAAPAEPAPRETAAPVRGPRRVLVAEDSITARIFLARMLEQSGLNVRAVSTATELLDEIVDDGWSLVLLDVDLPDRRDVDVLSDVAARLRSRGLEIPIVALVRDDEDIARAAAAGIHRILYKPFARRELDRMLLSVGLDPGDVR